MNRFVFVVEVGYPGNVVDAQERLQSVLHQGSEWGDGFEGKVVREMKETKCIVCCPMNDRGESVFCSADCLRAWTDARRTVRGEAVSLDIETLKEVHAVLTKLQWIGDDQGVDCRFCWAEEGTPHEETCQLFNLLKKLQLRNAP